MECGLACRIADGQTFGRSESSAANFSFSFRSNNGSQKLVFGSIETDNDFVGHDQGGGRPAVKLVSQNSQKIRICSDVSFFKGNAAGN